MSPNGMELNKIAAAVLLAGLIGMVAGKASEFLYYGGPQHHAPGHEEKRGYKIEVTDAPTGGAGVPQGPADLAPLYASADIEAGKTYFGKKCTTCHTVDKGGANGVGPNLHGVVGRKIASHGGFSYSQALQGKASESWDFDHINHWLWNPRKYAPGNIMAYAGTPKDQERANLIAYLNSMSDRPLPYPAPKPVEAAPEADAAGAEKKAE
jgi:cytochrome c